MFCDDLVFIWPSQDGLLISIHAVVSPLELVSNHVFDRPCLPSSSHVTLMTAAQTRFRHAMQCNKMPKMQTAHVTCWKYCNDAYALRCVTKRRKRVSSVGKTE
jgi:hypothetical protein